MKGSFNDLTGRRFERLEVMYRDPDKPKGTVYWICRCDCKKIVSVRSNSLISGASRSCGCLRIDRNKSTPPPNKKDLSGQTYGNIHIIEFHGTENQQTVWRCKCLLCGEEFTSLGYRVTTGKILSCGCLGKENKEKIYSHAAQYLYNGTYIANIRSDKLSSLNKSGVKGISRSANNKLWIAQITLQHKVYKCSFKDFERAVAWRKQKELELFVPVIEEFEKKER